jgi:hypothetical protein
LYFKDPNQDKCKDSGIPLMLDPCGKVGDLRCTLAQLSGAMNGRPGMRGDFHNLVEEQEESDGRYIIFV